MSITSSFIYTTFIVVEVFFAEKWEDPLYYKKYNREEEESERKEGQEEECEEEEKKNVKTTHTPENFKYPSNLLSVHIHTCT